MDAEATLTFVVDTGEKPINFPSEAGGREESNVGMNDRRRVVIRDARTSAEAFSLDVHGFELVEHVSRVANFFSDHEIERTYASELTELLRAVTRAAEVVVFDHTRRAADPDIKRVRKVRGPSWLVHNDYTPRSAEQRVRDKLGATAESRLARRFGIVNVWRPIQAPVRNTPLALCDARSIAPEDLVATERRARDRIGEIYRLAFNPAQRWYFFPEIRPDEALLIKTFDSAADGRARFAPHAAFIDERAPAGAPPRQSIESRAFVFY